MIKPKEINKHCESPNSENNSFFISDEVKKSKNRLLKERLRTLINNKGLSEAKFYNSVGISKQYWYFLSWGLWDPPLDIKIKISKALDSDSSLIFQEAKQ